MNLVFQKFLNSSILRIFLCHCRLLFSISYLRPISSMWKIFHLFSSSTSPSAGFLFHTTLVSQESFKRGEKLWKRSILKPLLQTLCFLHQSPFPNQFAFSIPFHPIYFMLWKKYFFVLFQYRGDHDESISFEIVPCNWRVSWFFFWLLVWIPLQTPMHKSKRTLFLMLNSPLFLATFFHFFCKIFF